MLSVRRASASGSTPFQIIIPQTLVDIRVPGIGKRHEPIGPDYMMGATPNPLSDGRIVPGKFPGTFHGPNESPVTLPVPIRTRPRRGNAEEWSTVAAVRPTFIVGGRACLSSCLQTALSGRRWIRRRSHLSALQSATRVTFF